MDRAKYAEALDSLLGNKPEARAMGARGCHWSAERHGFTQYVDDLETFFVRTVQSAVVTVPTPDLNFESSHANRL
jgi:hypothetical protein